MNRLRTAAGWLTMLYLFLFAAFMMGWELPDRRNAMTPMGNADNVVMTSGPEQP